MKLLQLSWEVSTRPAPAATGYVRILFIEDLALDTWRMPSLVPRCWEKVLSTSR